jgi:MFS family permease
VIANSGWFLPQLFTANTVQRLPRRKPVVVNLGFFTERLPLWLLPLSALLAVQAPGGGVAPLLPGLCQPCHRRRRGGHGLARSGGPHHSGEPSRPFLWHHHLRRQRHGRFGRHLQRLAAGRAGFSHVNFVATFALAALFITLSWAALAQAREPEQRVTAPRQSSRQYWAGLPRILAQDHNFRRYINARLLMVLGGMGAGFLTVAAVSRWQVSDGAVGLYTLALLIGQTLGNAGAGFLADQRGHKLPLELGSLLMVIAYLLAWLAPGPAWYYAVFLALGIATGAVVVSGMMIVLEFSPDKLRPTYAGLSNTAMGLLGMVSPLIGAWLASRSYDWLFALSALFWLAGLTSLRFWVREPRGTDVERLTRRRPRPNDCGSGRRARGTALVTVEMDPRVFGHAVWEGSPSR